MVQNTPRHTPAAIAFVLGEKRKKTSREVVLDMCKQRFLNYPVPWTLNSVKYVATKFTGSVYDPLSENYAYGHTTVAGSLLTDNHNASCNTAVPGSAFAATPHGQLALAQGLQQRTTLHRDVYNPSFGTVAAQPTTTGTFGTVAAQPTTTRAFGFPSSYVAENPSHFSPDKLYTRDPVTGQMVEYEPPPQTTGWNNQAQNARHSPYISSSNPLSSMTQARFTSDQSSLYTTNTESRLPHMAPMGQQRARESSYIASSNPFSSMNQGGFASDQSSLYTTNTESRLPHMVPMGQERQEQDGVATYPPPPGYQTTSEEQVTQTFDQNDVECAPDHLLLRENRADYEMLQARKPVNKQTHPRSHQQQPAAATIMTRGNTGNMESDLSVRANMMASSTATHSTLGKRNARTPSPNETSPPSKRQVYAPSPVEFDDNTGFPWYEEVSPFGTPTIPPRNLGQRMQPASSAARDMGVTSQGQGASNNATTANSSSAMAMPTSPEATDSASTPPEHAAHPHGMGAANPSEAGQAAEGDMANFNSHLIVMGESNGREPVAHNPLQFAWCPASSLEYVEPGSVICWNPIQPRPVQDSGLLPPLPTTSDTTKAPLFLQLPPSATGSPLPPGGLPPFDPVTAEQMDFRMPNPVVVLPLTQDDIDHGVHIQLQRTCYDMEIGPLRHLIATVRTRHLIERFDQLKNTPGLPPTDEEVWAAMGFQLQNGDPPRRNRPASPRRRHGRESPRHHMRETQRRRQRERE